MIDQAFEKYETSSDFARRRRPGPGVSSPGHHKPPNIMFLRFVLCGLALVVALDPDPEPGNVLSSGNEPPSGTPLTTVETTPDADSRTVLAVPAVPPSDPPATYGSTGDLLLPQQNTPVVVIEESDDPAPAKSWTRW